MRKDPLPLPLLDFLAHRVGCYPLSNLHIISGWKRSRLSRELELIPPEAATLQEWNDALVYLTHDDAESTAAAARNRLIQLLASGGPA